MCVGVRARDGRRRRHHRLTQLAAATDHRQHQRRRVGRVAQDLDGARATGARRVESALGHHLQLVLIEEPDAARQILADLSANKKGRASIAPLGLRQSTETPAPDQNGSAPEAGSELETVLPDMPFVATDGFAPENNAFSHTRACSVVLAP